MTPEDYFPLIIFAIAFLLPILFKWFRRGKSAKLEELLPHLRANGIKGSTMDEAAADEEWEAKSSWGRKLAGIIAVEDRSYDAVALIGQSSQYDSSYLEFLVRTGSRTGMGGIAKTGIVVKKRPPFFGKPVDLVWSGSSPLAQRLNSDYSLKYRLLQEMVMRFSGGLTIEPRHELEYTRIRIKYQLLSPEMLEIINLIAKQIKAA